MTRTSGASSANENNRGRRALTALLAVASAVAATAVAPPAAAGDMRRRSEDPCADLATKHVLYSGSAQTLVALASCHETHAKTASAWAEYQEAASLAKRAKAPALERRAKTRAKAIEPRLAKLTVRVVEGTVEDRSLEIRRDGVVLDRGAWGTPLPVDQGVHVIEVWSSGRLAVRRVVDVHAAGDKHVVVVGPFPSAAPAPVVSFASAAPAPAQASSPASSAASSPAATATRGSAPASPASTATLSSATFPAFYSTETEPPYVDDRRSSGTAQRALGLVVGSAGLVGLGAGAYFGLDALERGESARRACPSSPCTDRIGVEENERARDSATISTVAIAAGGAAVVVGALVFFTAPSSSRSRASLAPAAAPGYAGLRFEGTLP